MKIVTVLAIGVALLAGGRFILAMVDPGVAHGDLTNALVGCAALLWIAFHLLASTLRKERDPGRRQDPPKES